MSQTLPVLSLLLSATLWGLVWYPLRLLEQQGMAGMWLSLITYGACLITVPWLFRNWSRGALRHPLWLATLTFGVGWCNVAFILAVLQGEVVRVILLFYLSPLWTVILGRVLLGESVSARAALALVSALCGAMLVLWSPDVGFPWPREGADWLALSAGLAFSASNVAVRRLQDLSLAGKVVFSWWGVVLIASAGIAILDLPAPPLQWSSALGAVGLGLFGFLLMTVTVQYGVSRMPVRRSATIILFEVVVATLSAHWLAQESITGPQWLGGFLILAGGLAAATEESS
ncbi:MAG: DMT family transporter [Chromatiales bacterium]|nr:DMT family transporter [Chromatiales bacterium]